ncbi:MAG: PQQ-dependent sugar dehydrogenase, partial [Planctomycetales bacterium]|nr:PQQ-dependent sugar dehydrogenase [Planctomycetales bacterium]
MMNRLYRTLLAFAPLLLLASPASAGITGATRVANGLSSPLFATYAPGDKDRLFVLEKGGRIRIVDLTTNTVVPTPFLTINDTDAAGEGGLLGLAFHPDYQNNGKFYVYVTVDNGGVFIDGGTSPFSSRIREYTATSATSADPSSVVEVLNWVQPRDNHNGGWVGFGPNDGYLYITSGDGGKQDDPDNNAQTLRGDLKGKILRIDVDQDDFPLPSQNYAIPEDNPFAGSANDNEIWAYGLRNPYRASFDRQTGDFWIGDVGQNLREEIDFQPADSPGGVNYAWKRREGFISHQGGALLPGDTEPVYDYTHGSGGFQGNSVTGGYVYR